MDLQLKDRVAVVAGGGHGVGAAIARALAAEGVRVAVADIDHGRADRLAGSIGGIPLQMDVTVSAEVEAGCRTVIEKLGALNIIVNNVGLSRAGYLDKMTESDIDATLAANIRGALNVTRAAVPHLRAAGWGRFIYIGSGSGLKASAGLALYSASKYFLHGLCVAAGLELGRDHVTANIICPSDVYPAGDTPAGSWLDRKLVEISCEKEGVKTFEELKARRIARTPAGRACTEHDIAALAVFLASPLADFINAQAIGVNGGSLPN